MNRCQPHDPGSLYVLAVASWLDWIMPFLSNGTAPAEVACWQRASAAPARLMASGSNPVILLSHHDTLLRDAAFAQGRSTVLAQPAAIARLAHDKRAMADVASRVDGLRPIPQLTLTEAIEYLTQSATNRVIVKPGDSTEGRQLRLVETPDDLWRLSVSIELDEFLLQPALEGHEYSVNMIADGRFCHTYLPVSKGSNKPFGVHPARRTRTFPARIPWSQSIRLMNAACGYALATEAKGLLEVEFLESDGDLYLMELNPRLSATLRMAIVSSQENLLRAMHRLLGAGLSSCRFVPATGHSFEIPLPDGLSSCALAALRRLGDVHVSSRITMAAPTIEQLADLRHLASRVLAEDGHDRAATLLVTG